jgi:hypothetical protein
MIGEYARASVTEGLQTLLEAHVRSHAGMA